MNLSKLAFAALVLAIMAAPAAASAAKEEGWYVIENGSETSLHLTIKLPAGKDNTKNIYACYYTPDAGKSEKDRWTGCGIKRDPRMPKEEAVATTPSPPSAAPVVNETCPRATSPTDCCPENNDPAHWDCPAGLKANDTGPHKFVQVVSGDPKMSRYLDYMYEEPRSAQSARPREEPFVRPYSAPQPYSLVGYDCVPPCSMTFAYDGYCRIGQVCPGVYYDWSVPIFGLWFERTYGYSYRGPDYRYSGGCYQRCRGRSSCSC